MWWINWCIYKLDHNPEYILRFQKIMLDDFSNSSLRSSILLLWWEWKKSLSFFFHINVISQKKICSGSLNSTNFHFRIGIRYFWVKFLTKLKSLWFCFLGHGSEGQSCARCLRGFLKLATLERARVSPSECGPFFFLFYLSCHDWMPASGSWFLSVTSESGRGCNGSVRRFSVV